MQRLTHYLSIVGLCVHWNQKFLVKYVPLPEQSVFRGLCSRFVFEFSSLKFFTTETHVFSIKMLMLNW